MTTNCPSITTRQPVVDDMSRNQSIGLTVARHPGQEGGTTKASKLEDVWLLSVSAEKRI